MIKTENLTKEYGQVTAVKGLNLQINEGEIFGLLGPNGAGKTTTILMLMGLTEPTSGWATVAGRDARREPLEVKRDIGYLPDNVGFYEEMTGRENLRYTARLNAIEDSKSEKKIEELLQRVGLASVGDNRVGTYSRGMCQRLGIADVLLKDPQIVILDEPTNGIDPQGISDVLEIIRRLSRQDGRTVLVSSHLLHQVQQICDRVGIFVEGELVAVGPIASLGEQLLKGEPLILEVQAKPSGLGLKETLEGIKGVEEVEEWGDMFLVHCGADLRPHLAEVLGRTGFHLLHLRRRGYSLDDIYRMFFSKGGLR